MTRHIALGEVSDINPTFKSTEIAHDDLVDFLPMASVNEGDSLAQAVEARPLVEVQKGYTCFNDGDVLLAKITPCFENGKITQVRLRHKCGFGSTEFHVLRPHADKLDGRYLVHFLRRDQIRIDGERKMTGSAGQRRVPKHFLESLQIPLPPLPEQRRIAAILDQADALRAKRREALAQLDSLTQSIFIEMFGDPNINEKGWKVVTLGSICKSIWDIDHKMPKSVDTGIPFVSAKDLVENGNITFDEVKFISRNDFERLAKKGIPAKGDIIYSRIGANLGKARLVKVNFPFLASYSCCTIRPESDKVCRHYLCHLLDSPYLLKQAHRGVRAIAVPDLGMGEIKNFQIILPPLELQYEFSKRLEAIQGLREQQISSLMCLNEAFSALQHRAFQGAL